MKRTAHVLAVCVALGPLLSLARADEAEMAVARIIQGLQDDGERARKLLDAAKTLDRKSDLVPKILERAVDYAGKCAGGSDGFQAGLDALKELDRRAPKERDQWARRRVELCRRAYLRSPVEKKGEMAIPLLDALGACGDRAAAAEDWAKASTLFSEACRIAVASARRREEFERKQRVAAHFATAEQKLANLKARLARKSDDARVRQELLQLLVADLDDPNQACQYLTPQAGQVWTTYLPLAAKDIELLPESICKELSNWYEKSLAAGASPTGREKMLLKARAYCQRAIELHAAKDLALVEAQNRLERIDKQLKQLDPVQSMLSRLRYVDMLKLVDLGLDATEGNWLVTKGAFCSTTKAKGTLCFPVDVTGSYRLALTIAKTQGARDVNFTLPAGDRQVEMTMHEYYAPPYTTSFTVAENVTWIRLRFENVPKQASSSQARVVTPNYRARSWVPYSFDIAVKVAGDQVQTAVTMNRAKWISWTGSKEGLKSRRGHSDKPMISIGFNDPGLLVSAAKLRIVDGEVTYRRAATEKPR
ncbi:MAG: hypothetical protein WBF17_19760 [Phycisphaerae bacterium]